MADDLGGATAVISNPNHHSDSLQRKINTGDPIDGGDFISTLPNAIIHLIFSSFPTKFAIRTSVLSKRWRHVWSHTPFLSIECPSSDSDPIIETLTRSYSAPKITSFHLSMSHVTTSTTPQVDSLIEFAISHNTEKLSLSLTDSSLTFPDSSVPDCKFPLVFYDNSSLKELLIDLGTLVTIPTVSWTSLKKLFLSFCQLSDASFAKIIFGSPLLESLTLHYCVNLKNLDLTNSLKLRSLDIENQGPMQIVAPHVHSLRLKHYQFQCGLVNVFSLTEADMNITCSDAYIFHRHDTNKADSLVLMIMKMLEMLQNVEKLTFGATFLQILSLAEVLGVPFPTLKVQVLNLETVIVASVIPAIAKLLENSPSLKKLKLHLVDGNIIPDRHLNNYLYYKGFDTDQCWKPKDWDFPTSSEPELMRFMEFLLENTRVNY